MARRRSYDLDEVLAYAAAGLSAAAIVEELGLKVGERTIQKAVAKHLGHRPTKASLQRYDPIRSRVAAYMVTQGHDPRRCSACDRFTIYPLAIREVRRSDSLDDLVFVCRHCATPADR